VRSQGADCSLERLQLDSRSGLLDFGSLSYGRFVAENELNGWWKQAEAASSSGQGRAWHIDTVDGQPIGWVKACDWDESVSVRGEPLERIEFSLSRAEWYDMKRDGGQRQSLCEMTKECV
jgi:hypothetical protein